MNPRIFIESLRGKKHIHRSLSVGWTEYSLAISQAITAGATNDQIREWLWAIDGLTWAPTSPGDAMLGIYRNRLKDEANPAETRQRRVTESAKKAESNRKHRLICLMPSDVTRDVTRIEQARRRLAWDKAFARRQMNRLSGIDDALDYEIPGLNARHCKSGPFPILPVSPSHLTEWGVAICSDGRVPDLSELMRFT